MRWAMLLLGGFFGILALVPIVHFFTNFVYWIIRIGVYANKYSHRLTDPKIIGLMILGVLVGLIPFVGGFLSTGIGFIIDTKVSQKR